MSTPDHTPDQQPGTPPSQTTWGHDEPPKRSWFARHKVVTGILGVLGLFIIIGAMGGDEDPADSAAQPSATSTSSAEEGAGSSASSPGSTADEPAAEEETPAETSVEEGTTEDAAKAPAEEASDDPQLGDVVQTGDFEVSVTGVEGGMAQIGDDMLGEEAQGQFVKVLVTVENTGDAAEYFLDSEQKLVDDSDRQHSTSSASWMLDEESLFLTEINPGNRVEGVLLYDIPEDAVPTSIDLQGGFFSSPVRVALQS